MSHARIEVPAERIAEFCRRHHIRRLALFGSVLRDDFTPESDVDMLVEFEPGKIPGFAFFGLSFAQLAPGAVDAGHLTKEDADVVGERLQRGDKRVITPSQIAAVGRKPQT